MQKSVFQYTAIGLAALGVLAGATLFRAESAVLTYGGPENAVLQDEILKGTVSFGYSAYADQRLLSACLTGMSGIRRAVNTEEDNNRFADQCRTIAGQMISRNPLSSFAWCVRAQAHAILGDFAAMNHDLRKSWAFGRFEGWIAQNRNMIAEANFDRLDAETKAANDADLAIMALSPRGIAAMTPLYRDNPDFRARIGRIVATLAPADQERFLHELKRRLEAG